MKHHAAVQTLQSTRKRYISRLNETLSNFLRIFFTAAVCTVQTRFEPRRDASYEYRMMYFHMNNVCMQTLSGEPLKLDDHEMTRISWDGDKALSGLVSASLNTARTCKWLITRFSYEITMSRSYRLKFAQFFFDLNL